MWLTDVPFDLATHWFVRPRPEGVRCIVVTAHGQTVSRDRNGAVLHWFESSLPDGSSNSRCRGNQSFLDCVFCPERQVYYVMDVMCWNGVLMFDAQAVFRLYWLAAKLAEVEVGSVHSGNHFKFLVVPVFPATREGLQEAHGFSQSCNVLNSYPGEFRQDGLWLFHSESHYVLGSTPLALCWKDAQCSKYLIDHDGKRSNSHSDRLSLVLSVDEHKSLLDAEGHELGVLSAEALCDFGGSVRPGSLLKFSSSGVDLACAVPALLDLRLENSASPARLRADAWSKILFQYLARLGHAPTLEALCSTSQAAAPPPQPFPGTVMTTPSTQAHAWATQPRMAHSEREREHPASPSWLGEGAAKDIEVQ
jgi:snurportin-1